MADDECPVVAATADYNIVVNETPPVHRDDGRTLPHFTAGDDVEPFVERLDSEGKNRLLAGRTVWERRPVSLSPARSVRAPGADDSRLHDS